MAEYLSPGVYVEEYDNSPRTLEGIGTSTAGFVGMAVKGATVGAPSLVTNFGDFKKQFGGYLSEYTHNQYRYLAYSVEQFFTNGGTRCYVARVAPSDAVEASIAVGGITISAKNVGKWGNKIMVTFTAAERKKFQLTSMIREKTYVSKSVDGIREGDMLRFEGQINQVVSIFENTLTFADNFNSDPVDDGLLATKVLKLVELDVQVVYDREVENYAGITMNNASPNFFMQRMKSSELVTVSMNDAEGDIISKIFGEGAVSGTLTLEGGTDGSVESVNAGTFIGEDNGPGKRTGIAAFVENSVVSMMAVPGITTPEVMVSLVAHCENLKNRFAVLDMPEELYKTNDLIEYRGMIDSTYAAMYHTWIQIFDRASGKPGFIPPSGAVMGVYSRTDISRGVHKAPANETVSCTGLSVNYTTAEQDIVNPQGVNLIRAIPGQGFRIWGARTASSNSTFKYVNVRRLFIFVEESIRANTNWVVFEPNDVNLWTRVQLTVSSFLETLWRNGMLSGSSTGEAFFVEIGTSTMSRDDIMAGRLICNIGIAPSRPAEFVIFLVTQHTS